MAAKPRHLVMIAALLGLAIVSWHLVLAGPSIGVLLAVELVIAVVALVIASDDHDDDDLDPVVRDIVRRALAEEGT